MNARVELKEDEAMVAMRLVLKQIMGSALFAKAPRARTLLAFLVEKKLDGKEHEITEQSIGVTVFRRDAGSYDTSLDPIVRVQMGRLRTRLAQYHGTQAGESAHLTIPLGSYIPLFSQIDVTNPLTRTLELMPLRNLTGADATQAFVAGVDEELGCRLFAALGSQIHLSQQNMLEAIRLTGARHRLEGSIRVDQHHVRASVRLVETHAGSIAWLSQIDCSGELGLRLQEEIAGTICERLQHFLQSFNPAVERCSPADHVSFSCQ